MENLHTIFRQYPGPFILISLGLISASFILLRWNYLRRLMQPGYLLVALAVFIGNIYIGLSMLSRALHIVYP
jgi:hypothetical protein